MSIWNDLRTAVAEWLPERRPSDDSLGNRGERKAERYLKKKGLRIVERGYRNHIGEIDLVAVDQKSRPRTIVFVEVKTRQSDQKGQPADAVDDRKQRQISHTALVYLKENDLLECRYRFDIVGLIWPDEQSAPEISHLVNAFEPVGQGQMFS